MLVPTRPAVPRPTFYWRLRTHQRPHPGPRLPPPLLRKLLHRSALDVPDVRTIYVHVCDEAEGCYWQSQSEFDAEVIRQ